MENITSTANIYNAERGWETASNLLDFALWFNLFVSVQRTTQLEKQP